MARSWQGQSRISGAGVRGLGLAALVSVFIIVLTPVARAQTFTVLPQLQRRRGWG